MSTLFVNALTVIDASYLHSERGLLGESWLVDIELEGSLDDQGMVLDFGLVKRRIKQCIDTHFDHKLLVPARYPQLMHQTEAGQTTLEFTLTTGELIRHESPRSAVTLVETEEIGLDSMTEALAAAVSREMPSNVEQVRMTLRNEARDGIYFQYSHGLKHHAGNCQRIAHGHRSRMVIFKDEQPATDLESEWATHWHDIYIANRADLEVQFEADGVPYSRFGYTADQGRFGLSLPTASTYLIDTDSTIENLAQHIADELKRNAPSHQFRVYAYEGVDKGAIGIA